MRYLGWLALLLLAMRMVYADRIPAPPPLVNEPVEEQLYLLDIYENFHVLPIVTANPNGSRRGQRGEIIYASFGGAERLCVQTGTGPGLGTTWRCVTATAP